MDILIVIVCIILLPIALMALVALLPFIIGLGLLVAVYIAVQPSAGDAGVECVIVPDSMFPSLSLKKCTDEEGNVFYEANSE